MDVKSINLKNIGRFEELDIEFAPNEETSTNVTVFIGNNGAGKSTILKSLATSLSWLVSRIIAENGHGEPLNEDEILNSASFASIDIAVTNGAQIDMTSESIANEDFYRWTIAKTKKGRASSQKSHFSDATKLAENFRHDFEADANCSFPVIAYYPVERTVIDIPQKVRTRHTFLQLDGYDDSLNRGVDFRRFFEWFRDREDSENEQTISSDHLKTILADRKVDQNLKVLLEEVISKARDRQLNAVRSAIYTFMPGFTNLRVRRKPRLHMAIDKDGSTLDVAQLSGGEKSLMALVGDIARRVAMMNPDLDNPLVGDGIILIDEIELHLHPRWQRTVVAQLISTFPNCQFVLTTHSPLVISDVDDLLIYSLDDGELNLIDSLFGEDVNSVLAGPMNTDIRNVEILIKLGDMLDAISENDIATAERLGNELSQQLPSKNIELAKAKLFLKKRKLKNEKDL